MTFLFQCTALVGQVFAFVFTVRLLRLAGRPKAGAYFIAAMGLLLIRSLITISQPDPQADQNQFALYGELCLTLFALFAALGTFLLRTHVRTQVLARWTPGDPASEYSEIGVDTVSPPPTAPKAPTMDEGDAQILCNSSMEVTELNQAAARLLGRDRQDFYGKSIANFVRREEMLLVPELFREVAAGMASSSEWNFRKPDETLVPVRIAPRSHFNDQVRLILQDLTEERERQRTEVDSGKQDTIMAQLLDAADDGYVAYDADLKVIGWNRAMENMSGVSRSQCMNQHLLMHFPIPEELAEEDFIQEALEGHTHDLTGTELVNSKTGESESVNHHFGPLANSAGEIIGGMIRVSKSAALAPAPTAQEIGPEPQPDTPATLETPAVEEPQPDDAATISMPEPEPTIEPTSEPATPTAVEIDEAALRAMRILQAAPQLISTFDLMAHQETYANRSLAIELGFAPDLVETMGKNVMEEIVHPEDQRNLPRHAEEWLGASEGERRITEYRVADPEQNWHWFQTTDTPFDRNEDGVVTSVVSITEDITVRKELELQLRQAEQEHSTAPASMPAPETEPEAQPATDHVLAAEIKSGEPIVTGPAPTTPAIDGYVTYDHDLKITEWNEGMVEFTGTQIEQCIGQIVQMHLPIPDELAEEDYILESLEGHSETIENASVLNPKTGEEECFKYEFGPLSDLSGTVVGGFVRVTSHVPEPITDIATEPGTPEPAADIPMPAIEASTDAPITMPTEPPPPEPAPIDEEAELAKRILAAAPQLVSTYDLTNRRQTFANRELALQLGFPQEQVDALGDAVLEELVHPEDQRALPRRAEHWAGASDHERRVTEYRVSDPERRWHWFQSTDAVLERDDAGKVSTIVSVTEEITERKEQERQLRLAEQKYRTFSEHCPTGIWHITAGGRTHYLNPAMCALLGADSPADLEGYTYQQFLTEESQQTIAQQAGENGDATTFQIDIQRLDGSIRHCILHGAPEFDEGGQIRNLMGSVLDVTERAEAVRLLSEQEARYRAIVEQTPDLICRFDQDGRLSYVNGAYSEFFGQTRNELLGGPFAPKIPKDESAVVEEMLSTLEPTMEPRQCNCRVFRADGEERATRWTLHAVSDDTGSFIEYQAVARDITDRRAAERALSESEAKFRGIFEQTNIGIFVIDAQGRFAAMNEAYVQMTGRSEEELLGEICTKISHPDSHEESQQLLGQLVSGESESAEMEKRYLLPDESEIWVQLTARGIRDNAGRVNHIICIARDVTQSHESRQALEHSERKHRHLIEHHPYAIVVTDHNRILFENPAAEPLFGHPDGEQERTLTNILPQESIDEINRCVEQAIEQGEDTELHEATFKHPDGSLFAAEFAAIPVEFEGTIAAQLVIRDISVRRAAQEALHRSEEHFRTLAEKTGAVPWQAEGSNHQFTFVGPQAERIFGHSIDDWTQEGFFDLCLHEDDKWALEHFRRHVAEENDFQFEYRLRTADNDVKWVHEVVHVTREEDGNASTSGFLIDVTQRKQAELDLTASERQFRDLTMQVPAGIFEAEPSGNCTFVNPKCLELAGMTTEDDPNSWLTRIHPDDAADMNRIWKSTLEEQTPVHHECRMQHPDGREVVVRCELLPQFNENEEVTGYIGTLVDLTALKNAERQLREKESLLMSAINNLPFDLWACDTHSRYILQNDSSRNRWGDRLGKKPEETGVDPEILNLWHENNHRALQGETVIEHVRYHHEEDLRDYQSIVGPIRQDDEIVGFLGANIDISDLKTAERRLADAETKLQDAEFSREETENELRELKATLDERETSILKIEESRDSYKTDFEKADADLTTARSAQAEAESDRDLAQGLLKETEADLADAKATLEETKTQLEEARQSLEEKEAVRLEVETSQASAAEELTKVAALLAAAEAARDENQAEADSLRSKLADAAKTNEDSQAELDLTKEALSEAEAARTKAAADLAEVQTSISEKDTDIQQLKESKVELEADLEKSQQALADTETERDNALKSVAQVESDLESANARVAELESATADSEKALAEANNKLAETESLYQELEAGQSETITKLSEAEAARDEVVIKIEALESAKTDADSKVAQLQNELNEAIEKLSAAEEADTTADTPPPIQLEVPAENLVNELPEMVWMSTADGQRGFFNGAWLEFTGRTADESAGTAWRDAIHGQDRDGVIRTIQRAVENQEPFTIEYRLRAQDGTYHWVEDAGVPRMNSEGEITDYLGTTHNITSQIRREEELKAGMRQLEWAQSRAKLGSWEYRPRGDHRQWSRQTFELYNQSPNDGTPETYEDFLKLIHDEDRDKLRRANDKVLKTGQPLSNLEYRTNPETGPVRHLSASTYRIPEQDGSAYYLGGTVMDVTEQKAAEENVRRSEERYRKIIEVAEEGVWMMDMEGYTSFVNPRMMRMLGYKYREFIGRHFFEFLESESLKEAEEYMERREKGITEQAEFTFLRKNGQPVNVLITSSTLSDAEGDHVGVLSFVSDITERKVAAGRSDESQREMQSILSSVPNLILTVDTKRIVQFANREHAGMNPDQITGTPALNWIAPDHREAFETAIDDTFQIGDGRQVEVEGLGSDGTQVQYRCHLSAIGEGGTPDSVAIVFAPAGQATATTEPSGTADDQLVALTQKLFAADEAERRRIANELHDQFGQALSAAKINLQALAKTKQTAKNKERLQSSLESLESLIGHVRKLSEELRPSILDDLGLEAALRWLVDQQADSAGFAAEFKAEKIERIESDKESALYRITETALDNIARHAGAKQVAVDLTRSGSELTLSIQDDGAGFDIGNATGGIGLPSMEQRARLIGGNFTLRPGSDGGTTIEVKLKLPVSKPKAKPKRRRKKK